MIPVLPVLPLLPVFQVLLAATLPTLQQPGDGPPSSAPAAARFEISEIASPAAPGSRLPRLASAPGGGALLSWVEQVPPSGRAKTAVLRCAEFDGEAFGAARTIAKGDRWFVNWADFPVVAARGTTRLATFLEKTAASPYAYHVRLARSSDGGATWSEPETLHTDRGDGEHGFVSLAASEGGYAAVWLDGRHMTGGGDGHGGHGGGSMALLTRTVGADGALGPEVEIDGRVCECCGTAAIALPDGALLVAYRDRSDGEVRDVSIARVSADGKPEHLGSTGDGWKVAGCPVNGPALAAGAGERVGLAWFTMGRDGTPRVLCALSGDGGRTFGAPVPLADGSTLGRVGAVFDGEGRLVVSWLHEEKEFAEWRLARVDPAGQVVDVHALGRASASRSSGFGQIARDRDGILFAWTEPGDVPRVAVRRVRWR